MTHAPPELSDPAITKIRLSLIMFETFDARADLALRKAPLHYVNVIG